MEALMPLLGSQGRDTPLSGKKDHERGPDHQIPPWTDHDSCPTLDKLGLN